MRTTTLLTVLTAFGMAFPAFGQSGGARASEPARSQARSVGSSSSLEPTTLRTRHRARYMPGRPTASGEVNVAITDRELRGLSGAEVRERLQQTAVANNRRVRRVNTVVDVRRPTRVSLFSEENLVVGETIVSSRQRRLDVSTTISDANLRIGRARGPRPARTRQTASLFLAPEPVPAQSNTAQAFPNRNQR